MGDWPGPYSLKYVEGKFSEVRGADVVLRSSLATRFRIGYRNAQETVAGYSGVMTQRTGGQDRGVGGMSGRAAAWLAWSLVVLSVVLLVGGISFALMIRSRVPDGSVTRSVLALTFS